MKVVRSLEELRHDPASVVTVGTFDGVHLAHQEIIREVQNRARMKEGRSVVVTFDPHPKEVVDGNGTVVPLLSTIDERMRSLKELNVDVLFIIPFTFEFSRLSSRAFFELYIVNGTGVSEVVVGYDHMFGRDREAGIENLVRMGQEFHFSVFAVQPFMADGEIVSSTLIRKTLGAGDVTKAGKLLGYPYSLSGRVVRGDGRGTGLGYPTANIIPQSPNKVVPANGVYLVAVETEQRRHFGMMNIGTRPTVTEGRGTTLEVHILEFERDIYNESITVTFLRRLRDERRFASVEELKEQLGRDRDAAMKLVATEVTRKS